MQVSTKFSPAKFWTRFASFYLNLFLLIAVSLFVNASLVYIGWRDFEFWTLNFYISWLQVLGVLWILDSIIQGIFTANIAKLLLGLRLYDCNTTGSLGILRSLWRSILSIFSLLFFGLGYFAIAFNLEFKSMHDLLSSSRVVRLKQGMLQNFVTGTIQFFTVVLGLLATIAVLGALAIVPWVIGKSFIAANQYSYVESALFKSKPNAALDLPISNNKIAALANAQSIDYIEFEIHDQERASYISKASLAKLGMGYQDYYLTMQDLDVKKIKPSVILPSFKLKDSSKNDVEIFNQEFILTENQNLLGADLLETWDYTIDLNQSKLVLKYYPGDLEILTNPKLEQESKYYLLHVLREIRLDWDEHLRFMDAGLLEEFTKSKQVFSNQIKMKFNTETGYIEHISLEQPSESEDFNKFCKEFFDKLDRFRLIPQELVDAKSIDLAISLRYKETI